MELESATYTRDDLVAFLDEMQDHDRQRLANRLHQVSQRLAEVGPLVKPERGDGREWTAHELLAHIATLSKYYGVLVHKVTSGRLTEVDLLDSVHLRDAAINQMAEREPKELVQMALADHERTVKTLRTVNPGSLRKAIDVGGTATMTAEELARLPLITHLETHIEQLERMLGR